MLSINKYSKFVKILMAFIMTFVVLFFNSVVVDAGSKKAALNLSNITLTVGKSRQLSVSNAKKVKWSSSKKSVVQVNKKGKITAKKNGTAVITAKFSGKSLKCNVVVHKASNEKDILITYFSWSGTTKSVAKKIKKLTGGDLLRIREKNKYSSDYDKLTTIAKKELNKKSKVKSTTEARNIRSYDVIYIGYPIWWHSSPRVVNTFLEKYNLRGKTIIPFCTSGGSDIKESIPDLKKSCKNAKFKAGYTAQEGTLSEIRAWLKNIGELSSSDNTEKNNIPDTTVKNDNKILVAYFSWSGTSERIAKNIINQTGGDSFRIEREIPYSEVAYGEAKDEADNNARPPIKTPLKSIEQYDKIILCYPIWWHTAPMTVGTFLEKYNFSGKTIYPVSQSASMDVSQYNQSVAFIKANAKDANVDNGLFSKNSTEILNYIKNTVLK